LTKIQIFLLKYLNFRVLAHLQVQAQHLVKQSFLTTLSILELGGLPRPKPVSEERVERTPAVIKSLNNPLKSQELPPRNN
jgi:hypothetical protein